MWWLIINLFLHSSYNLGDLLEVKFLAFWQFSKPINLSQIFDGCDRGVGEGLLRTHISSTDQWKRSIWFRRPLCWWYREHFVFPVLNLHLPQLIKFCQDKPGITVMNLFSPRWWNWYRCDGDGILYSSSCGNSQSDWLLRNILQPLAALPARSARGVANIQIWRTKVSFVEHCLFHENFNLTLSASDFNVFVN